MANGSIGFSFKDYGGENASVSLNIDAVTASSIAGVLTQIGTLRTAIEGVINGTVSGERLTAFNTKLSNATPTSQTSQVERKLQITYEDVTDAFGVGGSVPNQGYRKIFNIEIPCLDVTKVTIYPESDNVDLTALGMPALVTALEATLRSPYGGNINVLKATHVGSRR